MKVRCSFFRVVGFQGDLRESAASSTARLKRVRVLLASIAYRKWDFSVMGFSRSSLKPKPLDWAVFVAPPLCAGCGGGVSSDMVGTIETSLRTIGRL